MYVKVNKYFYRIEKLSRTRMKINHYKNKNNLTRINTTGSTNPTRVIWFLSPADFTNYVHYLPLPILHSPLVLRFILIS